MAKMLPMNGAAFMHIVGTIEMIVGPAILTRWTGIGSYVAVVWLVAVALNLLTTGRFFDVAARRNLILRLLPTTHYPLSTL
jgi:hypothetical protein